MARDFLQAINSHVVIYDGGMGATLEQFDLTAEDYGGLKGKCHEALVLNRPDVIQGVHEPMTAAAPRARAAASRGRGPRSGPSRRTPSPRAGISPSASCSRSSPSRRAASSTAASSLS